MEIIFFNSFPTKLGDILFMCSNSKVRGNVNHLVNLFNSLHKCLIILLSFYQFKHKWLIFSHDIRVMFISVLKVINDDRIFSFDHEFFNIINRICNIGVDINSGVFEVFNMFKQFFKFCHFQIKLSLWLKFIYIAISTKVLDY